ncbi:alcohol dehydrogenase catalytic domain-containing protein [Kineococcus terrestris]|uniref:alcohol dehydrogenase catalytic domain-containing protein n=1 Tax=Kineococcus terrestris TaxID=2044856 RepID=UPI0034DAC922
MSSSTHAAVVPGPREPWVLQERPRPGAGPGQVLVEVRAGAVCGTDLWMAHGDLSYRPFPLVLGHEGVGEVVAVGAGVTSRAVGDRVGMPMVQRGCGTCAFCRQEHPASFVTAANCASPVLTGVTVDGAFAEHVAVDAVGTVVLPDGISYEDAAPTLCAGYTSWAALRRAAPAPGARVGVVGIGGVGHFAVQYAKAAGHHVTAVTRSPDKERAARELGADEVVGDGAALAASGGVDLLLHTSSNHASALDALQGLRPWGKVAVMGIAPDDFALPALGLVSNSWQVVGTAHNGLEHLVEALQLVADGRVAPVSEVFAFADVEQAHQRAASGRARFKAVVTF